MITQLRHLPYFLLFDIIKEEKHFGVLRCNRGTDECHVRAILSKNNSYANEDLLVYVAVHFLSTVILVFPAFVTTSLIAYVTIGEKKNTKKSENLPKIKNLSALYT